jgi:hypothetical protein
MWDVKMVREAMAATDAKKRMGGLSGWKMGCRWHGWDIVDAPWGDDLGEDDSYLVILRVHIVRDCEAATLYTSRFSGKTL